MQAEIIIMADSMMEQTVLVGPPKAIASWIAEMHADMTRLCHEGRFTEYTLLTVFDQNGKVVVR